MARGGKSYAKETVRARTGREVDEQFLRELYIDRRHSQQEIATAWGVSRETVKSWLAQYGITRDERPAVAL